MPNKFPQIVGIVNTTPDSFSDGGVYNSLDLAFEHSLKLIDEGADILDIGGESTRPGALEVELNEELERVIPLISKLKEYDNNISISVDTTKYEVAKQALDLGCNYINDISGLQYEPRFLDLAKEYNVPIVVMHMKGTPRSMQIAPTYDNVKEEVFTFFQNKIDFAKSKGFDNIIADVGIGFGKNLEHNLELLNNLDYFQNLNVPLYLGISRKSFIKNLLGIEAPLDRDLPTLIIHTLLLYANLSYIRVHEVKQISMLKKLVERIRIA
jgi:dihydropteroate synthase